MTVMITGAGLVGSQVAKAEIDAGRRPVLFDINPNMKALGEVLDLDSCVVVRGDVVNPWDLARAIAEFEVRRVVHTAANPRLTPGAEEAPYLAAQINIMGWLNVLEAARTFALERVVVCSTSSLYISMGGGEDDGAPGMEEAYPRPNSVYAVTKQAAEGFGDQYARLFGVDAMALRLAGVYGPFPQGGGVGTETLRGLLEAAIDGREVLVPRFEIDWVYSTDAARGLVQACWLPTVQSRVVNISSGELTTAEDLVDIITELVPAANVRVDPSSPLAPPDRRPSDLTRAREQLGFEPELDMRAGMRRFFDFIVAERGRSASQ